MLFRSTVIILTNVLFGAVHLTNAGKHLTTAETVQQCVRIILTPAYGVLFYITGDVSAPLTAHMTNYGTTYGMEILKKQITSQIKKIK